MNNSIQSDNTKGHEGKASKEHEGEAKMEFN
jgi:hypothetical protein